MYIYIPISHLTVIGGFGGRGMVSQSIHKPFLPSARKAFTRAFTKHSRSIHKALTQAFTKFSQRHSQSSHKLSRAAFTRAFTRTFAKVSQILSRKARRFVLGQPHGPECGALPRAARRFFQGNPHELERGAEKKKKRRTLI